MFNDETVTMERLAEVISADPSLVLKIIHLANSPFYMVSRPIESVKDGMLVLGLNTIKNITTAISLQRGLSALQPSTDRFDMLSFWKHSYATAIVSSKLGKRQDNRNEDMLYLAGLIHDIGKLIMAYHWPDVWKGIVNTQERTHESFAAIESRLFPHSHASIAAALCRNWQLPKRAVDLIGSHHDSPAEQGVIGFKPSILSVADRLVNYHGICFPATYAGCSEGVEVEQYSDILGQLDHEVAYQLKILE